MKKPASRRVPSIHGPVGEPTPAGPRPRLISAAVTSIPTYYTNPAPVTPLPRHRFDSRPLISLVGFDSVHQAFVSSPAGGCFYLTAGRGSPAIWQNHETPTATLIDPDNRDIHATRPKTPHIVRRRERPAASADPNYPHGLRQPLTRGQPALVALFAPNRDGRDLFPGDGSQKGPETTG